MGGRAFTSKGGGVDRALRPDPPPKGSIDGTLKILPRLTPGPQRTQTQKSAKNENGILGDSASSAPEFIITDQWCLSIELLPESPPPPRSENPAPPCMQSMKKTGTTTTTTTPFHPALDPPLAGYKQFSAKRSSRPFSPARRADHFDTHMLASDPLRTWADPARP